PRPARSTSPDPRRWRSARWPSASAVVSAAHLGSLAERARRRSSATPRSAPRSSARPRSPSSGSSTGLRTGSNPGGGASANPRAPRGPMAGSDATVAELLRRGAVIPAHPLALDAGRKLDERRQRALTRYYCDAGAGGVAVGVHTTQFQIREAGLLRPVLALAVETVRAHAAASATGLVH